MAAALTTVPTGGQQPHGPPPGEEEADGEDAADREGDGRHPPAAPDVGHPAPDHDPDRPRRARSQGDQSDAAPAEPPLGAEELVAELRVGGGEQVGEQAGDGEEEEAPPVPRHLDLPVAGDETPAL